MRKSILAALVLGVTMLTGCSMEQKMVIHQDLSATATLSAYTTQEEEAQIMKNLVGAGNEATMTYEDLMKELEMQNDGVKTIRGVAYNCYSMTESATPEETKTSFIELTKEKAVMDIASVSETQTENASGSSEMDLDEMGFCNLMITYPFKVAKTNGTLQPDGCTVVYDMKAMQSKKVSRAYAVSASALKASDNITIKGVKNKKAYKKPVTVKVSSKGTISYFAVNGKVQSENTYYASKDGKYKVVVKTPSGKRKALTFYVDRKKPTTNVKNNKVYKKNIKLKFKDSVSGIKKATLNGKKIKSGKTIKKNGNYTLKLTDKAGNVKVVKFTINK